jgi:hypothetical protein
VSGKRALPLFLADADFTEAKKERVEGQACSDAGILLYAIRG